jgi:hypothetical protein
MAATGKNARGKASAKKAAPAKRAPGKRGDKPAAKKPGTQPPSKARTRAVTAQPRGDPARDRAASDRKSETRTERSAMPTMLFYKKPVVLNRETHKNLKLKPVPSYAYAANTNSVPLAGNEFAQAARQLPILFIADAQQNPFPIALLGLRKDENLFVDEKGKWDGNYVPAFIRRYPYVLGEKDQPDDFNVCIDEEFPGFNEKEGEPLFNDDGTEAEGLKRAVQFLNAYQQESRRTEAFCLELKRLDLLVPQKVTVTPKDSPQYTMDGFSVVDEARLLKLDDAEAGKLLKSGYLGWIYAHLLSTHNITDMSARLEPRLAEKKSA